MARRFASTKRTQADDDSYYTRKIEQLFKKMEANRHARYEEVLDAEELSLAKLVLRAAINHVREKRAHGKKLPKTFLLYGRRYPLNYSNWGRVFVATKSGARVIASDYDVI